VIAPLLVIDTGGVVVSVAGRRDRDRRSKAPTVVVRFVAPTWLVKSPKPSAWASVKSTFATNRIGERPPDAPIDWC